MVTKVCWDRAKADANRQKHGVRFEEAEAIFRDPAGVTFEDPIHADEEDRFLAVGEVSSGRLLIISYTIRNDEAWLISARALSRAERRRYVKGERIRELEDSDDGINFNDIPEIMDFSGGVRGRHYIPMSITRVSIADDVARYYDTDEAVNSALRNLIVEGRAPKPRDE